MAGGAYPYQSRGSNKEVNVDKVTKATLTLLIAEIQACQDMAEVNRVLDSWIEANGLRPEKVGTVRNCYLYRSRIEN